MLQKKSSPWARAKYLYVLPLAAVAIIAFAHPEIAKVDEINSSGNIENASQVSEKQEEKKYDQLPEYPGGTAALGNFISSNFHYPAEAQENGEQGRVVVQFVVEKDGSVTNPEVVQSVSPALDAEALRIVKLMPKWKPGMNKGEVVAVKYSVPLSFRLE